jgi:hypothetical protein
VLVHLDRAEPNEKQFFEQHRPKGVFTVSGAVAEEAWAADLYHAEEDEALARLFGAVAPGVRRLHAQTRKSLGLRAKDRHDPATSALALAKALRQASAALGTPAPDLFVVPRQPGGLIFAATDPPASVAGQDFLSGLAPAELRFVAARHLASYRREHALVYLLRAAADRAHQAFDRTLLAHFRAAVAVGTGTPAPPDDESLVRLVKQLSGHVRPEEREALEEAARDLPEPSAEDLVRWAVAADLTADRAGLLFCGDPVVAMRMLSRVPPLAAELPEQRRIDELLLFAVSDAHFRLRRQLGIALAA